MSAARWSRRKDGTERTTWRLRADVPRDLIEWLTTHTRLSERAALGWVRQNIVEIAMSQWENLFVVADSDGDPFITRYDEGSGPEDDDYQWYDGPHVHVR